MDMTRITSNVNLDTHKCKYFRLTYQDMKTKINDVLEIQKFDLGYAPEAKIADPYARNCEWNYPYTNDIDPDTRANHNMDALDFLRSLPSSTFHGVVFDPPFSEAQARRYEHGTANIYTTPGAITDQMNEIRRILMPGGFMLKFGYNSTRHNNFDLIHTWLVNHGGNHNDTIVTLWQKGYYQVGDFS